MTIGFLGFGEAAVSMSSGFKEEGLSHIFAYDSLLKNTDCSLKIINKMNTFGVMPVESPEEIAAKADVIFAAVPANFAVEVAGNIVPFLNDNKLYVDVTTASPEEKKQISELVSTQKALFVDAAMLGALPKDRHKVPMLISGDGSDKFIKIMTEYNMNLTKINNIPGAATSIKYIRSIITKGLACLLIEALNAAGKFGVEKMVMDSMSESLDSIPFDQTIDRYVSGTLIHSKRRIHEIENVLDFLDKADVGSVMTKAVNEKLVWIDSLGMADRFNNEIPLKWKDIVKKWDI